MSDFRGFLCWDQARVIDTISTEAVTPSREVFIATHAPLRIRRRSVVARHEDRGEPVDERAVLNDFLNRPTGAGALLMPVIGDSGTGKSHLVRWIHEQLPKTTQRRRVIYLPKTRTSLVAVVDELLAGVEGEHFAQLREDVRRLDQEVDQAGLEQRLLNQLAEALAKTQAPAEATNARLLYGPRGLTVLLYDPHVREELLRPGSLIPCLAASLLADRQPDDGDRPLTFTVNDLPLDIADLDKASEVARSLLGRVMTTPALQPRAVELLNQHLDIAVMTATNLGVGRLQRAMLDLRAELARQEQEIVLLIEDFALVQGVQRDLLDAIIEPGIREGRQVLAPIRTLMAVTSGFFGRLADTVITRATAGTPYIYDLDAQFGDDVSDDDITSFIGRYLNAARLGRDRLEHLRIRNAEEVPNACDQCAVRDTCHRGFETSSEGYGLYPFNKSALLRAVHARAPDNEQRAFNARAVLSGVVRHTLVEHALPLRQGEFPNPSFRRDYPTAAGDRALPSAVAAVIEERDRVDPERRKLLLEMWGDAPDEAKNLDAAIHEAFAIEPLSDAPHTAPAAQPSTPRRPVAAPSARSLPLSLQRRLQSIEDWASRGATLGQEAAADVRSIVTEAVASRCQWAQPLMREPRQETLRRAWRPDARSVSIEDAMGEGLAQGEDAPIRFRRNATTATFFQGILKARAGVAEGTTAHLSRLAELADRHTATLQRHVRQVQDLEDEQLVLGLRASLLGAALAGYAYPGCDDAKLLAAALDDGAGWQRSDARLRTAEWTRLLDRHRTARADLVDALRSGCGVSQGTGAVRMVDAHRLLPLLRAAAGQWSWETPAGKVPDWLRAAVQGFSEYGRLVSAQLDLLREWVGQVRERLPRGTSYGDTVEAITRALDGAVGVGVGPTNLDEVRQELLAAGGWDARPLEALDRDLDRLGGHPDGDALLATAAPDRGPELALLADFLDASDNWLSAGLQRAALRANPGGDDAVAQLNALLERWASISQETSVLREETA
jgi:AAA domain